MDFAVSAIICVWHAKNPEWYVPNVKQASISTGMFVVLSVPCPRKVGLLNQNVLRVVMGLKAFFLMGNYVQIVTQPAKPVSMAQTAKVAPN